MKTFYHPHQQRHHPRTYFSRGQMRQPQEIPERLEGILRGLEQLGLPVEQPADHGLAPIESVHDAAYLEFLQTAHRRWKDMPEDWGDEVMSNIFVRQPNPLKGMLGQAARYLADGSCPIGEHTWLSSYWAAQSAIAATHEVLGGQDKAYALCRPPGHHARADAAGGFCYVNHAAVAAELLRSQFSKVVVLDTDMHHGQGVQDIFYDRSDVFYVSVHGDPTDFYPVVAGFENETGQGAGLGFNLNLPMPHDSSEAVFFSHVQKAIDAVSRFKPDALVFCLGFDVYEHDPQAKVAVTTEGFHRLGQMINQINLPTVVVQEGGYNIDALPANTKSFFSGLLNLS